MTRSLLVKVSIHEISSFKIFNFNPKATQTDMRAIAYPAEDPSSLKKPDDLMNYYMWMLSSESSSHDGNYIEYR